MELLLPHNSTLEALKLFVKLKRETVVLLSAINKECKLKIP